MCGIDDVVGSSHLCSVHSGFGCCCSILSDNTLSYRTLRCEKHDTCDCYGVALFYLSNTIVYSLQVEMKKMQSNGLDSSVGNTSCIDTSESPLNPNIKPSDDSIAAVCISEIESKRAIQCFQYLLVFTAVLESFAHGANDTANSTGPFSAVLAVYNTGLDTCDTMKTHVWVMVLGGAFVALGICTFGVRVIETIGKNLTSIDFHKYDNMLFLLFR